MDNKDNGLGPIKDTAVGEVVSVVLNGNEPIGATFKGDRDGCAAVLLSMDRLPNGKFGSIQRTGGVHPGDILYAINDTNLENMPHKDVMVMINNRNILRKQLKFLSKAEYYNRKKRMSSAIRPDTSTRQSFVSKVKRARVSTDSKNSKFAEYEIACQWRLAGGDRVEKDKIFTWSVWKRFSEFEILFTSVKKSLGWQLEGIEYPNSYSFTMNKYTPEFIERRREELNKTWQFILSVPKVSEFDKHHCCTELKCFLDVDNQVAASLSGDANNHGSNEDDNSATASPAGGLSRVPSRRLSTKQSSSSGISGSGRRLSTKVGGNSSMAAATAASKVSSVTSPPPASKASSTSSPSPAPVASAPAASSPPPTPAATKSYSAIMMENLSKYTKMKNMLPEGAVRQRMTADGISDKEQDMFFSGGNDTGASVGGIPPPPAAPVKTVAPPPAAPDVKGTSTTASAPPVKSTLPPKTQARANLLGSINARRID